MFYIWRAVIFLQNTAISNQMKLDMIYTFAELF